MDKLREAAHEVVEQQIADLLISAVRQSFNQLDVSGQVAECIKQKLENQSFQKYLTDQIEYHVGNLKIGGLAAKSMDAHARILLEPHVARIQRLAKDRVDAILTQTINQYITTVEFPEASINPSAIDWRNFKISIDQVDGVKNTSGIEDISDQVQLTIMNDTVVVEGELISKNIKTDLYIGLTDNLYNLTNEIEEIAQIIIPFLEENIYIRTDYRPTFEYHFGGELNVSVLNAKLRAGYALYSTSRKHLFSGDEDRKVISGGLSIRLDQAVNLELTFVNTKWSRFSSDNFTPGGVDEKINTNQLLIGFSYSF